MLPIGTALLTRGGHGPSMTVWEEGEVRAHRGPLHEIVTQHGMCWCDLDDVLPFSVAREQKLVIKARVWARWLDGRWYIGTIDGTQDGFRHVHWDDGDAMWLKAGHAVLLAPSSGQPRQGSSVVAPRWDGERQAAIVLERENGLLRIGFGNDEEAWVAEDEVQTCPENPFLD